MKWRLLVIAAFIAAWIVSIFAFQSGRGIFVRPDYCTVTGKPETGVVETLECGELSLDRELWMTVRLGVTYVPHFSYDGRVVDLSAE